MFWKNECEWFRLEFFCEEFCFFGYFFGNFFKVIDVCYVDYQRIVCGFFFGFEYFFDGFFVQGVGFKVVNGFGWKCYEFFFKDEFCGYFYFFFIQVVLYVDNYCYVFYFIVFEKIESFE